MTNSEPDETATYIPKVGGKYPEGAVVFNARTQTFHPMGGGPVYHAGPNFLDRFRVVTDEDCTEVWREATFQLDGIAGSFPGYTCGRTWNGWACPVFTQAGAIAVLTAMKNAHRNVADPEVGFGWHRNLAGKNDTFCYVLPDQEEDSVAPARCIVLQDNKTVLRVYPIGAQEWTWEQAELQNNQEPENP